MRMVHDARSHDRCLERHFVDVGAQDYNPYTVWLPRDDSVPLPHLGIILRKLLATSYVCCSF